jgi:hypothetical protein
MTSFGLSADEFATLTQKSLSNSTPLDSVVYLLCLEGSSVPDPAWSSAEVFIDKVVQLAQPSPAITHCELVIPSAAPADDMHFATYLGLQAGWGKSFGGQRNFYLGRNAALWRAVPIVCSHAAPRMRKECATHESTPYSVVRYLCSAPPLRAFAGLLANGVGAPAHCATLSARTLQRALPEVAPLHSASWYGPSTLYLEVSTGAVQANSTRYMMETESMQSVVEEETTTRALHTLLNENDDAVLQLTTDACEHAIRALTARCLELGLDEVGRRLVQKQLATALLRYSIVKLCGK